MKNQNKRKAKSLRHQGRSLQVTCWQPLTWRCPQPLGTHCHLSMASEGVRVLVHPGKPSYCSYVHFLHDAVCIWPTSLPKPHHPSSDTRNKRGQGLTLSDCFPPRLLSLSYFQIRTHIVSQKQATAAVKIAEFLCSLRQTPLGALPMHCFCPTDSPVAREGGGDQA